MSFGLGLTRRNTRSLEVRRNAVIGVADLLLTYHRSGLSEYFLVKIVLCLDPALQFWWDGWSQNTFLYCLAKSIW